MKRRLLWLAAPIVAAHAGCVAFPAIAVALSVAIGTVVGSAYK